jgi:hypothetical protein
VYENTDNIQRFGQFRFFVKFLRFLRFVKMATIIFSSHFYGDVDLDPGPDRLGTTSFLPNPEHADPDPADSDRYQFQADEKVNKSKNFPENFNMLSKILKIVTYLTLMRKIKRCKLALL